MLFMFLKLPLLFLGIQCLDSAYSYIRIYTCFILVLVVQHSTALHMEFGEYRTRGELHVVMAQQCSIVLVRFFHSSFVGVGERINSVSMLIASGPYIRALPFPLHLCIYTRDVLF